MQMTLTGRWTGLDGIEHDPYPKPSGMIANSFVEPEKHRVERRRRKQIELAVRESKAVQSMSQRNDGRAIFAKCKRADIARQRPRP
jgi:hypothetical protein